MAQRGFAKSHSITWDQMLEKTLLAYNRLIDSAPPARGRRAVQPFNR